MAHMGEFAEVMEQAAAAGANDSPDSSPASVPADSGSTTDVSATGSTSAPAPSTPGSTPAPSMPAATAAAPAAPSAAAPSGMVPAAAVREAREQIKQIRETYGWLSKDDVPAVRDYLQRYSQDPVGTLAAQVQNLLNHPTHGPQLRALMGGGAEAQDMEPQPDLRDPDTGEVAYSQSQIKAWRAWDKRQTAAELDQRMQPVQTYLQQQQQREQEAKDRQQIEGMKQEATARAQALFEPLKANPDFQAHKPAIQARWEQLVAQKDSRGRQAMSAEAALYRAFNEVVYETVIPGMSRSARSSVVAQLNRKPGATTPNPARATAGTSTGRPTSFREALERGVGAR